MSKNEQIRFSAPTRTRDVRRSRSRSLQPVWVRWAFFGVAVVVAYSAPFGFSDFALFQMAQVLALAIAVLSLNLLTGSAGQISIGHGALMGLSAYATVIVVAKAGLPLWVGIALGVVLCALVGLVLGIPSLRISGMYLALVTLGFALAFPGLVEYFDGLTNGFEGITYLPPNPPAIVPLTSAQWLYMVVLTAFVLCALGVRNLTRGRVGRALRALRESTLMARASGIRDDRLKVAVFSLSSAMAGLAGGLYQILVGTATPGSYTVILSLSLVTASLIGGSRTVVGALVGAAFVVYVPDTAAQISTRAPQLVYAVAILVCVFFFRAGVVGTVGRWLNRGVDLLVTFLKRRRQRVHGSS